jgi:hypothetical protein
VISCFPANATKPGLTSSAFWVGIDAAHCDKLLDPDAWDDRITIKYWRFKPKNGGQDENAEGGSRPGPSKRQNRGDNLWSSSVPSPNPAALGSGSAPGFRSNPSDNTASSLMPGAAGGVVIVGVQSVPGTSSVIEGMDLGAGEAHSGASVSQT